jgi:hypothetical protein
MSGGYGVEISDTVEIHLNTVLLAQALSAGWKLPDGHPPLA